MEINDLIGIGRLGGRDQDGWYHAMLKPHFKSVLSEITNCFLIFSSNRVFYVTITDHKTVDKKTFIRFADDGIEEERCQHKEVLIAIDELESSEEDISSSQELDQMIGFTVIHENVELGVLEDYFFNNAQFVLQVRSTAGKEILVPYVDYYISTVIREMHSIFLQNASSLIDL